MTWSEMPLRFVCAYIDCDPSLERVPLLYKEMQLPLIVRYSFQL